MNKETKKMNLQLVSWFFWLAGKMIQEQCLMLLQQETSRGNSWNIFSWIAISTMSPKIDPFSDQDCVICPPVFDLSAITELSQWCGKWTMRNTRFRKTDSLSHKYEKRRKHYVKQKLTELSLSCFAESWQRLSVVEGLICLKCNHVRTWFVPKVEIYFKKLFFLSRFDKNSQMSCSNR